MGAKKERVKSLLCLHIQIHIINGLRIHALLSAVTIGRWDEDSEGGGEKKNGGCVVEDGDEAEMEGWMRWMNSSTWSHAEKP